MNVEQMLEASLSRPAKEVTFFLVSSSGERIGPLEPAATSEGRDFLGPVTPRAPAFRIAVEGRDENDWPFQRFHRALFRTGP